LESEHEDNFEKRTIFVRSTFSDKLFTVKWNFFLEWILYITTIEVGLFFDWITM
jgi:hypothetical protein